MSAQAPPGVYGSDRMVFSKDGHSRSYFQFGFWSERPAQTLLTLAEARLARSQRFSAVAASTAGVRGDLLLSLRLDELYLDVSVEPARVRLGISAELVDWRQRTPPAPRRRWAPCSTNSCPGWRPRRRSERAARHRAPPAQTHRLLKTSLPIGFRPSCPA